MRAGRLIALAGLTGLIVLASTGVANAGVCDQDGYRTLKSFPAAVFMTHTTDPDETEIEHVYVCSPTYGVHARVGNFDYDPDFVFYGRLVARGSSAAWGTAEGEESGSVYLDRIHKADLSTGRSTSRSAIRWPETSEGDDYTGSLRSVAMSDNGSIAWIADYKKHGKAEREIHLWDSSGTRIVSRALVTTPKYLAFVLGAKSSDVTFSSTHSHDWPIDTEDSIP